MPPTSTACPSPTPTAAQGPRLPLEQALQTLVRPQDLAAVILEPVLGEGGFVVPPPAFVAELRAFCDRYGIVLIADEVQTGFGRTGTMFASERLDLRPDLMTVREVDRRRPAAGGGGRPRDDHGRDPAGRRRRHLRRQPGRLRRRAAGDRAARGR